MDKDKLNKIKKCVNKIIAEYKDVFDSMSLEFLQRVYKMDLLVYLNRLKAIGFVGAEEVLDAACGFGQWSLALASLNKKVTALDISSEKLMVLNKIIKKNNINNIKIKRGAFEELPFDKSSFNAIFCYSGIPWGPWKHAIKEFYRVLKTGGKLYVNANGLGFYLHLWKNEPNKNKDYNPREWAAYAMYNTLNYEEKDIFPQKSGLIIEPQQLLDELNKNNFNIIASGAEGTINIESKHTQIKPFFHGTYEGDIGVFEMLAMKK